jgi:hypothetical protein
MRLIAVFQNWKCCTKFSRLQERVAGSAHATEAGKQNIMTMEVLRTADTKEIQLMAYCKIMMIAFHTFLGSLSRNLWPVEQQ